MFKIDIQLLQQNLKNQKGIEEIAREELESFSSMTLDSLPSLVSIIAEYIRVDSSAVRTSLPSIDISAMDLFLKKVDFFISDKEDFFI